MRDRIILGLSIVVLFGGLAVWAYTGRGVNDDQDRRQYIQSLREPPALGVELHPADPRGTAVAEAFRRAGLGEAPLRILLERDHRPIVGVAVPSRDAMRVWEALRDVQSETHLAPVILGDGFSLARHADAAAHTSASIDSVLHRASTLDLDAWLASQPAPDPGTPIPVAPRPERWQSITDPVLGVPILDVAIALLPVTNASDAPAWLAFGNWSGCPDASVHVAILRRLEALASVQLVAITSDRVELRVITPPADASVRTRIAELLARWDPSAFAADRGTIASWSSTVVTSRSWSLSFPRSR